MKFLHHVIPECVEICVIIMNGGNAKKQITIRIDSDLHKKLKIKATAKDVSINEYITSLIAADVGDIDLSGIVGE